MLKALHNPKCSYRLHRNVCTIFLTFSFCYPPKINLVTLKSNLLSYYFYVLQHKNKAFVQDSK